MGMSNSAGPFEPDRAHVYDLSERQDQLRRFAFACQRVARSFADGDWPGAEEYAQLAEAAMDLSANALETERLKAVATALPPEPSWMGPRMPDYNGPRQPWQDEAASARAEVNRAALEMRAWATCDSP